MSDLNDVLDASCETSAAYMAMGLSKGVGALAAPITSTDRFLLVEEVVSYAEHSESMFFTVLDALRASSCSGESVLPPGLYLEDVAESFGMWFAGVAIANKESCRYEVAIVELARLAVDFFQRGGVARNVVVDIISCDYPEVDLLLDVEEDDAEPTSRV